MKKNVCIVVSSLMTVNAFLAEQIKALADRYEVTVIANGEGAEIGRVGQISVPIVRPIAPWRDLWALWLLFRLFRRHRFALIHSVTPKAGLLAMVAGRLAGIPRRLHTFTGQVWVGRRGGMRLILKTMDRILAACATHILVDSFSQRRFLIAEGVVTEGKTAVLARGSICGVDRKRFRPDAGARQAIRAENGIGADEPLILYLGRFNRDKGLLDLAHAFAGLALRQATAHLLLVGPDEGGMAAAVKTICAPVADRLHFHGFTSTPERYMAAADIFCLPSYREGFGSVIIEAGACGVPAVASRIYGITDAVVDGETGLLHEKGDVASLQACLAQLLADPSRCRAMGNRAAERAAAEFDQAVVTAALLQFYQRILQEDPRGLGEESI